MVRRIEDPDGGSLCDTTAGYRALSFAGLGSLVVSPGGSTVTLRYRRSTAEHGIIALPRWSDDLTQRNISGGTWKGVRVELTEAVVDAGAGYEIVELTATVVLGKANSLFFRLELSAPL